MAHRLAWRFRIWWRHCDWIGHDCRSGVYTADYFARRGAWAGLRSGAGRHAGSHDPAMQQRHHEVLRPQVSPGHRGPVFQLLTRQNACTVFQNRDPLCENGLPNPKSTGNDATGCASNTEVQYIWERTSGTFGPRSKNAARWLFFASHPKQPRPPKGAPSAALSSVKTPGSGDANGRVGSEQ